VNEILEPDIKRKPTVLETIPPPTTLDNFLKNQEELKKPLVIGEPVTLPDVTTLDAPQSISLDDLPEEQTEKTINSLTSVEQPPSLTVTLSSPIQLGAEPSSPTRSVSPIQLGAPVEPIVKKRGRPPLSEEEKKLREITKEALRRPVGRPVGTTKDVIRARLDNRFIETEETSLKSTPQRRASLNLGRPIGTSM
jgi:hypothetical protein